MTKAAPTATNKRDPYRLDKSNAHFRKAVQKLPLGVSSNFRYWGDHNTVYVKHGRGARITDLDDNVYIDYRLGYGPAILGHCHPEVDAAARDGQQVGTVFALGTERELTVAELISEMVPAAELVRFSNSGTEAVMGALRLARGVTGKDHYVTFEGSYHGLFDSTMWTLDTDTIQEGREPDIVSYGKGIPGAVRNLFWQVPYNDAGRLEDVLKKHGHTIAAVLIEPILGNCCGIPSKPEFIKAVRELCTKYGVLMIVDEVKTGFRVRRGGAQELYGIKADICTMAKAVGNGYPIACIGGREDIMRNYGRGVAHGGTYTAQAMSLAAAEKTLTILRDTDALEDIEAYGLAMQAGMHKVLTARGIPHSFTGHPSMSGLFFRETPPSNYRDWKTSDYTFYDTLAQHLIPHGVMCEPDSREPWFISSAHDKACLDETLSTFEYCVDLTIEELARTAKQKAAPVMTGITA
ncbi:glutamate-1-semialdehyde 2,1-aminomutase [Hypericibacter terrae]|jgi:glutamate-1-semialdehyde 2,1-aminomutase|uniref:Glutamate-1-semialdehyde 2,1-aminomutase n=1 Tax=Hypericibacter terrae TaxID=2602015 RepID=A0A5J6MIS3_9PROT|nr:aspartate aminotransferase family protein [Hypericibacter terrae]QEX17091.1 glutamate-1-semialdehyde 2,1-aminomutase [Hypericibacter terrae]